MGFWVRPGECFGSMMQMECMHVGALDVLKGGFVAAGSTFRAYDAAAKHAFRNSDDVERSFRCGRVSI